MGEYFKPLRRKLGVLTLVVACVLLYGWGRSFNYAQQFDVTEFHRIGASHGILRFDYFSKESTEASSQRPWQWHFCGLSGEQWYPKNGDRIVTYEILGWLIILPLALLSALLLLSKLRTKSEAATTTSL